MALERYTNNFSTTLAASVGSADTTLSLTTTTGLVASATGVLTQTRLRVEDEVVIVTAVLSATQVTVVRGQEGTAAVGHLAEVTVRQVVTAGALLDNAKPGGLRTTLATGTVTYTPDLTVKYHFLSFPTTAATTLRIAAPIAGPTPIDIGEELRFHFAIGGTSQTHTLSWTALTTVYHISPAFSLSTAVNTGSSISFSYSGTGLTTANAWRRIN